MDNIEESVIKARTYAFFMLALSVDKKNPDWADVKIPAGNFPKGFEHCEALTLGQIVAILQITVKKKLQDIVDELNGGGTVNPHPPIECANGASWFEFHTDLGSQIEWLVSANGGPWLSIVDHPAVEYWYNPQNFGATMVIVLREGLPPTPIQLKASSPVAFYVNPSANVNDTEQENQSYVLYNSQDVIVDPTLEINKVYNSPYINDTSTELDYCVMFNAVDFCLKYPEGPPVGCAGAIDTFKAIYMTAGGLYNFYVNDVEFTGTNWMFRDDIFKDHLATFGVILNAYDLDGNPVPKGENGRYDGAYMGELINTSNNYVRIKIFCGDASAIDNFQNPINPAANWDAENNTLTVCLAPQGTTLTT
ncbi:hypothetical protein [Acinetobacter phage vB_AbaS_TCUP2199]|nr:hypothetical protein [Acinetobacter phage vB_AbaS_TCUP2199]